MTNKLHNRTLFVAALSVYFGLLIVGAPPPVLAQQSSRITKQKEQPTIILSDNDKEKSLTYLFRQLAGIINKNENVNARYSFANDIADGKLINFQVLVDEGNSEVLKILQDVTSRFHLKQLESLAEDFSLRRVAYDYKVDSAGIATTSTYNFVNTAKAKNFVEVFELLSGNLSAKKSENNQQAVLFDEITVRHENNQVLIVTRLPRAGLDSLVKANEKAN